MNLNVCSPRKLLPRSWGCFVAGRHVRRKGTHMAENESSVNRRDFMKNAAGVGATLGVAAKAFGARPSAKASSGRVLGANDRINIGVIGVGGRGSYLAGVFAGISQRTNDCKVVAVCDTYEKRKRMNAEKLGCTGYLDYREVTGTRA